MSKIIAGNWKMHGTVASVRALAAAVAVHPAKDAEVILCPPALFLNEVAAAIAGSSVKLGGQDCHEAAEGAFTGDISAAMLKGVGCTHVIVGHSERRRQYSEGSGKVRQKAARAIAEGLTPIICVGEMQKDREGGKAQEVVERQVRESVPENASLSQFLLAYEPVWAIGTGRTPTPDDIVAMHRFVRGVASAARVLYGGSVKGANAAEILRIAEVAGALVGGASLDAKEFGEIIDAAAAA